MICPNCGKEYNERMTCCISCGADLVPYEDSEAQTALELPAVGEAPPEAEKAGFVREIHRPVSAEAAELPYEEEIYTDMLPEASGTSAVSGAARAALSFAVSALMFGFVLLFAASAAVRLATDKSSIEKFADSLDVMNLPAAAIPTRADGDSGTVQEAIFAMSNGTGLTREDIRCIYESSTIRDFIALQLEEYAEFIRSGRIPEKLTADRLKAVFSENLGVIGETAGMPLPQYAVNAAFIEIDRTEPALEKLSPASLENALGSGGLTLLRFFSSLPAMMIFGLLAAAMLPLLRAVNRGSEEMLRWGGAVLLAGGAAIAAAVFVFTLCPPSGGDKLLRSIAGCAAAVIAPDLYKISGAAAFLGLVMLIWAGTLRRAVTDKSAAGK